MIFRAIQDKFKGKSGQKFFEDELKRPRNSHTKKGITNIACIVDMDNFGKPEVFETLKKHLGLQPNAIHIIGYKKGMDKNGMFSTPFCTDKDLGWNGSLENGDFAEFSGREYDVLINYFTEDRLVLKLMSVKTKARIRVGLMDGNELLNDLIFNCKLAEFELFTSELKKYLKILKEL